MARNGKIARLSAVVREQLNRRLLDGEAAKPLLEWLNRQKEVRETMKHCFNGVPVSEQNLTEWRQGGHQDWLRLEESRDLLRGLGEEASEFGVATEERSMAELMAARATMELAKVSQMLLSQATEPEERWRILKELLPHLTQLRRADHWASRLKILKERHDWEWIQMPEDEEEDEQEEEE
jgi:hypothetical protein